MLIRATDDTSWFSQLRESPFAIAYFSERRVLLPIGRVLSGVALVLAANLGHTQDYPSKTIRLLTTEPGSNNDLLARLITQGLSSAWGQPAVVENRGGGTTAAEL